MKNSIKKKTRESVENNVVDYFANSISSFDFVEKYIIPITSVSEEQQEEICNILSEYNSDWENADCDPEGATQKQDAELFRIIEGCANAIANVVT